MSEASPSESETGKTKNAKSEKPVKEKGAATAGGFPPYPPYATKVPPPSVANAIMAGRDLRVLHKQTPKKYVRPPPKPAKPRGPKATDVRLSKRAARAHARCLRRHGAVLTDRLERMAKPLRRNIIYLWREHADILAADTIARLRGMLDADEPFKPDQAYEYFINLRKSKKKTDATRGVNQIKKDMLAMCEDKRFVWARNATVAFARGIQQRLSRPGSYALADGMLRLSNIILEDICSYMRTRTPSRRSHHPKAKFLMEMSDKVAVWIDEILAESEDRMLMMDFDEDEEVQQAMVGDEAVSTHSITGAEPSEAKAAEPPAEPPATAEATTPDTAEATTPTTAPATTPATEPATTPATEPATTPTTTPGTTPSPPTTGAKEKE